MSESIVEARGLKFLVRDGTSDIKAVQEVCAKKGYERRDFKLSDSGLWIDYGANVGAFSCLAASFGARVVAYEADPVSAELATRNVELNGLSHLVDVRNVAVVADDRSSVQLHRNSAKGNHWRNSVMRTWRGGESLEVPAVHYRSTLLPGAAIKMDIEGAEMPILEAMSEPPGERLVFEWSFDVDSSIPRFRSVIEKARAWYEHVRYAGFDESLPAWKSEWFPPCRTVWCQGLKLRWL